MPWWNGKEVTDEEYDRLMAEMMEDIERQQNEARSYEEELERTGPFDPIMALTAMISADTSILDKMPDESLARMAPYLAQWDGNGISYSAGDKVAYEQHVYRCLQSHTSQEAWDPESAPSLWAKVLIPEPSIIPEWEQPDSTNPYMAGDKVTHNGKTWVSTVDNNVWEPGVYGWDEVPDNLGDR